MNYTHILLRSTLIFCLVVLSVGGFCQSEDNYRISDLNKNASLAGKPVSAYIHFPNINKNSFYYNPSKLKLLSDLEQKKNYVRLMDELEKYISNFGPANFQRDSKLLWLLAQLQEEHGDIEKAKWLFRLILRHTNVDVEYITQYYNKITRLERDYYVPLEYYYKLVEYRKQIDTLHPPRGVFLSMGDAINSSFEDYGPTLSYTQDLIVFASKRNRIKTRREEIINEDLYWAQRGTDGSWQKSEPLESLNTRYQEGAPCLSRDGKKLFFVRCDSPDGLGNCDIYEADRLPDGSFGNEKNLGSNVNSSSWDSHPSLSHSGDTLFFTSDRQGGFGANDIYFTYKSNSGKWMSAQNMGPIINTRGNDISPFYHPNHHVFYFSSDGHYPLFGNFDIYKVRLIDGIWQEPKNIGPLVNGSGDESFFTIDSESKNLYYARSSAFDMKNLNLFTFPLPMEAQPEANTVFKGAVRDSLTGRPFTGIVSVIDLEKGIEVAPKHLRPDGSFEFELINDSKYLLVIQGDDFFRIEELLDLQGDTMLSFMTNDINTLRIQFASIEFKSNSAEILPEMKADLEKLLDFMLANPGISLKISGHTDSSGDKNLNIRLSQNRADAIKKYLLTRGNIVDDRIDAIGYGSTYPIVKEELTEEDMRINRRVEFELIKPELASEQ